MAIGLLTVTVGCVLFFIPQFTTPAYRPQGSGRIDDTCASGNLSSCVAEGDGESLSEYLPIFLIARMLIGMGSTPIITVGVNYIDEFSTKEKFARYCGTIYRSNEMLGHNAMRNYYATH
jgi:Organic Anion Transporter Polypeptide (OATP) family